MTNRDARWIWLGVFALANLVCWVGAALVISLAVGDQVDLGVETFIRQGQATAVAAWERNLQQARKPTAMPASVAQAQQPAQADPAQNQPAVTITWPAPSTPLPHSQPTATEMGDQALLATSAPGDAPATPEPEATLVSSPLLMSNPEIKSLTMLNAEMNRSAPERAVQIRFQEDALNREFAAMWENHPELPYRNVKIDLKRDGVIVTGNVTVFGFEVDAKITGRVVAQDCLPNFEVATVSVEGLMTLPFIKDQIGELIREAMTWYPADFPLCLEQIVLEETRATVYGHRR
jgi:hypothetical protein